MNKKLTLNIGVRYDWQKATPKTKDAIGPRVSASRATFWVTHKDAAAGGFGKVYQYQQLAILATLQRAVIAPTLAHDTAQVALARANRHVPGEAGDANATACLNPVSGYDAGHCRQRALPAAPIWSGLRSSVLGGGVNTTTTGPIVDGDRRMAYVGVQRRSQTRTANNMAVSVDYVGNRGKDNTGVIDINEGPVNPATGRVTALWRERLRSERPSRAGCRAQFDVRTVQPGADARTRSALDTDFNSLELELERRMANHWSARVSGHLRTLL